MSTLATHAGWVLLANFALSLAYEIYRATAKVGASRHDSRRALVLQLPMYVVAAVVGWGLVAGAGWAAWVGLVFSLVMIGVSILYYNPVILVERQPQLVDWIEDLVFTGLLFVTATLLLYEVAGFSIQR